MTASARIKIGYLYRLAISVPVPTDVAGEWGTVDFIGVFRDEDPQTIQRASDEMAEQVNAFLASVNRLKTDGDEAKISEAELEKIESLKDQKAIFERQLEAVEGLEIERQDGSLFSPEEVRDYVLRVPRFRAALEKRFHEARAAGPEGPVGNSKR